MSEYENTQQLLCFFSRKKAHCSPGPFSEDCRHKPDSYTSSETTLKTLRSLNGQLRKLLHLLTNKYGHMMIS